MKRSFLLAICLSAAAAFAGAYDISDFTAKDAVSSDNQIFADNGGSPLSTATVDQATNVPSGNIVLRQKFSHESGINVYQLYMGPKGNVSSLTALGIPGGTAYSDVIKSKFYERRGMKPGDDLDKVYFDGKSVYVPGLTTAIAVVKGVPVELKADASSAAAATSATEAPKTDCDEFDVSCDDDIIALKNNKNVDVTGDLNNSNSYADSRDYSAASAAQDVKDRFGIADEVRFWSAVALSAIAAGSAVIGVLQQMKSSEANNANKELSEIQDIVDKKIVNVCRDFSNQTACINFFKTTNDPKAFSAENEKTGEPWTYVKLQSRMKTNNDTRDSYAMGRNIWFGITAVSLTTAIVLFAW